MAWDSPRRRSRLLFWGRKSSTTLDNAQPLQPELSIESPRIPYEEGSSRASIAETISPDSPPLVVKVSIKFTDLAIRSTYRRGYGSSQDFVPSDGVCDGLLRRIEHCCEELITRRDSTALVPLKEGTRVAKHMKFEMIFDIFRKDTGKRTERTFRSYQNEPLTVAFAKEVTLASHRMIGLFLSHHDKEFKWLDGSLREDLNQAPETVIPTLDAPLSSSCIPRSRFIESSQSFEFIAGYTIEVAFKSRSEQRPIFEKTLRINSRQNSPLNLILSENLLWQSFQPIYSALELKKQQFDAQHGGCELLEGTSACRHFDDEALHLVLSLKNNLGPAYGHLQREIQSKLSLFGDNDANDCQAFLDTIGSELGEARDEADSKINQMNDFELRILELKSPTWSTNDPFRFSLDPSASYSRRSIDAVLERVQSGIGDVLRGNNLAARVSAYKRGHLVLDKDFAAYQTPGKVQSDAPIPEDEENDMVSQLRARIEADVGKVCKDTCSLDQVLNPTTEATTSLKRRDGGTSKSASRPNSVCILPGGQRFFPLVPDRYSIPSRVSSGCLLEREPFDAPADVQTSDNTLNERDSQEAAPQEIETPIVDEPNRPVETSVEGINASLAADAELVSSDGIETRDYALTEVASRPVTAVHDESVVNEESAQTPLEPEQAEGGVVATPVDSTPVEGLEATEEPDAVKDIEPAEEVVAVEQQEPTDDLKPSEEIVTAEEAQEVEETQQVNTPEAETLEVEQAEPAQELDHDLDEPSHEETTEQTIGDPSGEHDETCSTAPSSVIDEFEESKDDATATIHDLSDKQATPSGATRFVDVDGDWTAPSTPSLSSGCESSPRHSLIITPHNLAAVAETERPLIRGLGMDYMRRGSELEGDSLHDLRGEDCAPGKSLHYAAVFPDPGERAIDAKAEIAHEADALGVDYFPEFLADGVREFPETEDVVPDEQDSELKVLEPRPDTLDDADLFESESSGAPILTENNSEENSQDRTLDDPSVPESEVIGFDYDSTFLDGEPDSSTPRSLARFRNSDTEAIRAPEFGTSEGSDGEEVVVDVSANDSEVPTEEDETVELVETGPNTEEQATDLAETTCAAPASEIPTADCELPTEPEKLSLPSSPVTEPSFVQIPSVEKHESEEASAKPALGSPFIFSPPEFSSHNSARPSFESLRESGHISGRGSVDDFPPLENDLKNEPEPSKDYRPATAGYLGLYERRFVEVGLRGALGGSRRLSLPLDHLLDGPGSSRPGTAPSLPAVPKALAGSDAGSKKSAAGKRHRSFFGSKLGWDSSAEPDGPVLPRMVMIFAGMALASKVLDKGN